jgi:hypothetical protein
MGIYGRQSTALGANLFGTIGTPLGTFPFSRFDSISDAVEGFGDLYPQIFLRWNKGVTRISTRRPARNFRACSASRTT